MMNICEICGKKRGRQFNHSACAKKRQELHAAKNAKRPKRPSGKACYTERNINALAEYVVNGREAMA